MAIDRRALLRTAGSVALAAALPANVGAAPRFALYAAARRAADGRFSAAIVDGNGHDVSVVELPARGHDLTVCPLTRRCVVFARRPGNFAVVFSADRSIAPQSFTTPSDRHFYGHGVFSSDGRLLYATENDFTAGVGVIGIYDARGGFLRVGEFPTYGTGPHDLALLRREPVLVIANGGLREHPDLGSGRRILNPNSIDASLVYVDLRTGDLIERHDLGKGGKVSLRHLDVGQDDAVILGAQHLKGAAPGNPLVFGHRRQNPLAAFELQDDISRRLAGYISSVAVDPSGQFAAVTSSRGALVVMLEIATGRIVRTIELTDVSGVAPSGVVDGFLLTTGQGLVSETPLQPGAAMTTARTNWQWDNHAVLVPRPSMGDQH